MLVVVDEEKTKRVRKYIDEMSSAKFLDLCYDFYNHNGEKQREWSLQ